MNLKDGMVGINGRVFREKREGRYYEFIISKTWKFYLSEKCKLKINFLIAQNLCHIKFTNYFKDHVLELSDPLNGNVYILFNCAMLGAE